MNNRLKINLIKERTLQRKNELEGKQNSNAEPNFFNSNKVFQAQNNNEYYQNFNKFPQNVDNNMISRPQNTLNENYMQPMISDNQNVTSPIQQINPYQSFPYQQQLQFSSNTSNQTANVKQQRQKAIATLRRRVEQNSPVESPTNNTFPSNNFRIPMASKEDNLLQNIDQNIYNRPADTTNIPLLSMPNNDYTYTNPVANQQYPINASNTNYIDGNNIISQQNPMASSTPMNNEIKGKLDNKNPLAILSRRVEKSKMDNQEKNKMEIMDQRKQSLQILENRTNERMYNNGNNDKGFDLFQHKSNGIYNSPKFSPYLNNNDSNGFPNPSLYPNKIGNIERNDSYSSTSSLTREGSGEIPTSPYDQYPNYPINSRIPSVDSSRISSLILPDANSIARYSSVSSRYSASSYMEEPQIFTNDYKSFSPQLYYQQQQTTNSSKSIIPSQRVSSLSYQSQNDIINPQQLGAIGNPVNKVNDKSSTTISNNSNSNIIQNSSPKILNNSSVEPEQNIRQRAIGTLMRRVKNNNEGSTTSSPTISVPPQRMSADALNMNNNNNNINNNNNPYGTLNHYNYNNTVNNNDEDENNKKHDQIRKNLFAKLNNRINTATKTSDNNDGISSPTYKHLNENAPLNSSSNNNFINNANNLTNEEKAQVRKSVMNIIGLRTKKNEIDQESQNNILNIPLVPFERKFIYKLKVNQILNLAMAKKRYIFVFNDALFLCKGIKQNNIIKYQIKNIFETKKLRFAMASDDTILEDQYLNKNPIVKKAVSQFAVNPIKSLRFLFQQKLLHCSSNSIAFFLHCMPGISKRQLGFFVGMPEHNDILEAYINAIPCSNVRLDQSLRFFLKTIRLPSDNDIINRILCCFAKIWHARNESNISFDYIMTLKLVFTLISLNAELHPPMTAEALAEYQNEENMERIKQSFINRFKNNNIMNTNDLDDDNDENNKNEDGDHYDIPLNLLQDMYESIKEEKIEVAPDNISLLKQNQDNFKVTFSYTPKNQTQTNINSIEINTPLEFPTKLFQNETSGVITVTLPHPNPYIQINIDTQDLKVSPAVLTFENSNKAEFIVTASKAIGRKLLLFTKRLSKAASQLPLETQRSILDSYVSIDSKCIKIEPAFMKHSIILETSDSPEGEKTSPLLSGRFNPHPEESCMNIKKYIFTVENDQKVKEFIQTTKDCIERAPTTIMSNKVDENAAIVGNNDFLAPPNGKDDPKKLISRTNSIENFSVLMYSDDINLNEEDQKFIQRCSEPVPRNIILLREYFLPNEKKFNTIGRSLSTLKITDMVSNGHTYHDTNSLGRRSTSDKSIDSLHDSLDENDNDIIPKPPLTTAEEKAYDENQFINIVLKQLLI